MSWVIDEDKRVIKALNKLPRYIQSSYSYWRSLITNDGIDKVKEIKGFHFEKLKGKKKNEYSCRLSKSYRVYFALAKETKTVIVSGVNKHDY